MTTIEDALAPTIFICGGGPKRELARNHVGDKWCFACRKRLPHDDVCTADVGPSYYDPDWHFECSGCGNDRTYFPGCGPL